MALEPPKDARKLDVKAVDIVCSSLAQIAQDAVQEQLRFMGIQDLGESSSPQLRRVHGVAVTVANQVQKAFRLALEADLMPEAKWFLLEGGSFLTDVADAEVPDEMVASAQGLKLMPSGDSKLAMDNADLQQLRQQVAQQQLHSSGSQSYKDVYDEMAQVQLLQQQQQQQQQHQQQQQQQQLAQMQQMVAQQQQQQQQFIFQDDLSGQGFLLDMKAQPTRQSRSGSTALNYSSSPAVGGSMWAGADDGMYNSGGKASSVSSVPASSLPQGVPTSEGPLFMYTPDGRSMLFNSQQQQQQQHLHQQQQQQLQQQLQQQQQQLQQQQQRLMFLSQQHNQQQLQKNHMSTQELYSQNNYTLSEVMPTDMGSGLSSDLVMPQFKVPSVTSPPLQYPSTQYVMTPQGMQNSVGQVMNPYKNSRASSGTRPMGVSGGMMMSNKLEDVDGATLPARFGVLKPAILRHVVDLTMTIPVIRLQDFDEKVLNKMAFLTDCYGEGECINMLDKLSGRIRMKQTMIKNGAGYLDVAVTSHLDILMAQNSKSPVIAKSDHYAKEQLPYSVYEELCRTIKTNQLLQWFHFDQGVIHVLLMLHESLAVQKLREIALRSFHNVDNITGFITGILSSHHHMERAQQQQLGPTFSMEHLRLTRN